MRMIEQLDNEKRSDYGRISHDNKENDASIGHTQIILRVSFLTIEKYSMIIEHNVGCTTICFAHKS